MGWWSTGRCSATPAASASSGTSIARSHPRRDGAALAGSALFDRESGDVVVTADWFDEFADVWAAGPAGDPARVGAVATIAGVFERLTRRPHVPGDDAIHVLVHGAGTFAAALDGILE